MLGDLTSAAKNHQDALRIAIKMQTLYGQSIGWWTIHHTYTFWRLKIYDIAVGNLGNLALLKSDFATAKTCFDQVWTGCPMLCTFMS